jgi:cation diffusion facilitator family transporter
MTLRVLPSMHIHDTGASGYRQLMDIEFHRKLAKRFIKDSDNTDNKSVRVQYGLVAGWFGIYGTFVLFVVKMTLGILSGSVSVIANAFHLLSHLANSIILVVSFKLTARPATAKNPFGHGRMEHIAPLIMSIFLFVSAIQIGERSLHQAIEPHELHYWRALPWILLVTIIVKQWLSQFVTFLGERVDSHAILANAAHHKIESIMTFTVIAGLVTGHHFHHPEFDGYAGILVSAWLLYLGYNHGKEALVPLLGQAPGKDIINKIRETAQSVKGIEDVHEIIVHDYGSMYLISLHAEIPSKLGAIEMHEITERCEHKLRKTFGGEVVCHMDPMMEMTPEIEAIEDEFKKILKTFFQIVSYHDFRVVAGAQGRVIIVADIDLADDVNVEESSRISKNLEIHVKKEIQNVLYCSFYITPKFSY